MLRPKNHWRKARRIEGIEKENTRDLHSHSKVWWAPPVHQTWAETLYCQRYQDWGWNWRSAKQCQQRRSSLSSNRLGNITPERSAIRLTDLLIVPRNTTIHFSSCTAKQMKKLSSQMRAHFFDRKTRISIIGFLTSLKLLCDMNNIHRYVSMWVLPYYLKETLANALKSHICENYCLSAFPASVRNEEPESGKILPSYPEAVIYLLKKFEPKQAIVENDAAILYYIHTPDMASQQYTDDLIAKSCKFGDVYDRDTLNDLFI